MGTRHTDKNQQRAKNRFRMGGRRLKKQIRCRKELGGCGILFSYESKGGSGTVKRFCPACLKEKKVMNDNRSRYITRSMKNEFQKRQPRRSCIGVLCRGEKRFQPVSRYNRICYRCSVIIQGISDFEEGIPRKGRK